MAEDQDSQEKTEQPTQRRLEDSRKKGHVPRSKDFNSAALLLTAGFGFLLVAPGGVQKLAYSMEQSLILRREEIFDAGMPGVNFGNTFVHALQAFWPFMIMLLAVAILAPMVVGGWVLSLHPLQPQWNRLDPLKGLGRIYSAKALVELGKTLVKFIIVTGSGALIWWSNIDAFWQMGTESLPAAIRHAVRLLQFGFMALGASLFLVALVDVPFQQWQYMRQLRMTRREVKEELKQSEGSPELRAKIRRMQRDLARRRMMEEVPTADVVITNPTHVAVALRYQSGEMEAPIVVAKGQDLVAEQIRGIAVENGVIVVRSPALARVIYTQVDVEHSIPFELYMAVAQILAYVHQLHQSGDHEGEMATDDLIPSNMKDNRLD